ncbi:MAG: hypothetical protein ACKN9F_11240, partial [Methylomonas sp.]
GVVRLKVLVAVLEIVFAKLNAINEKRLKLSKKLTPNQFPILMQLGHCAKTIQNPKSLSTRW